jgi:hypothetical protein
VHYHTGGMRAYLSALVHGRSIRRSPGKKPSAAKK